ncbi:MAG: ABC transporter ATP-binding protein [Gammaproteobacteria bacterium]|nr:ABC transporter ATP-binding protein [Gammaproteobacteria bacterium]
MSFLRLEGLCKQFGDFLAVDDVSLDIEKGEFVSLLGPSGCGKTTTLHMIAGFIEPTAGRVFINGKEITRERPNKRQLGIVFQSYALFPHMSVFENVSFGLEMRKVRGGERKKRVEETLGLVHLGDFAGRYPSELSGGQQQRVALARALVIQPEVLLLDEPLSALDAKIREDMQIELRAIQRTVGTTTILVTHDQAEAMAMSDRVAVMNTGRLVQVDPPFTAYEHPGDSFVSRFLGKSNMFSGSVESVSRAEVLVRTSTRIMEAAVPRTATAPLASGAPVFYSVRPEKIHLVGEGEARLTGNVEARIFLGNHWVFQIATELGTVIVVSQNTGEVAVAEGARIGLDWEAREVRVLSREENE